MLFCWHPVLILVRWRCPYTASLAEVFQPPVKPRPIVAFVAGLVLLNVIVTKAAPIKLTLTPKGANQVEFTFGPVVPGAYYQVLARTNSPEGHWMAFTRSAFVSSNE